MVIRDFRERPPCFVEISRPARAEVMAGALKGAGYEISIDPNALGELWIEVIMRDGKKAHLPQWHGALSPPKAAAISATIDRVVDDAYRAMLSATQ